jgi:hypothetical protein
MLEACLEVDDEGEGDQAEPLRGTENSSCREWPKEGRMAFSESLAGRIRRALARKKGVTEKKMFGGIGFLLHGNMLVGVWKESLIVRLDPERYEDALKESFVGEFDITGRAMRGWVLVEPKGIEGDGPLNAWIQQAVKFVGKLPAK